MFTTKILLFILCITEKFEKNISKLCKKEFHLYEHDPQAVKRFHLFLIVYARDFAHKVTLSMLFMVRVVVCCSACYSV